jgi:hypothetical protein
MEVMDDAAVPRELRLGRARQALMATVETAAPHSPMQQPSPATMYLL